MKLKIYDLILILLALILLILSILAYIFPEEISIKLWKFISDLGDETAYIVYLVFIYHIINSRFSFITILALLFSGSLVIALKEVFSMPRPENPKIEVSGYGFPSGHAQTSSAFWSCLYLLFRRFSLGILSLFSIFLISISRIALNVHFFIDIIGGILIGLAIGIFTFYLSKFKSLKIKESYLIFLIIFSLIVYNLLIQNETLIKISGIALGLTIHPLLKELETKEKSLKIRSLFFVINIIIILLITRIEVNIFLTFLIYVIVGSSIPILKYLSLKIS